MSPGVSNILIRVGAETADAVRDLGKVNGALGDTMTTSQKATAGIKKAAVPAAAALAGIGFAAIDATKAAMQDAAAQDKLAHQLKRTTGATDAQVKAAEDYITKLELQTGVADDDLRPALGKLATATGDVSEAQKELKLALDISAQTGKSLDTVTTALAKAHGGNTAALGKLIPGLDKATLATKDMHKITGELADLTEGAATEAANTASGKYKVWQVQMQELKETIGASLIPVVEQLGAILQKVTGFAAEHTTAIKAIVAAVATLSGGIIAINAALKVYEAAQVAVKAATVAWTAMQWLLNAALDANPIGAIILAIGALGGALVLAYKKSETFRDIVDGALGAVEGAANALKTAFNELRNAAFLAWDWVQDHWKLALFAFGPVGVAIREIVTHFDAIKSAAQGAWGWISDNFGKAVGAIADPIVGAVDAVTRAFRRVLDGAQDAWNWITNNLGSGVHAITDPIVAAIDAVTRAFRRVIDAIGDLIGWIGRIHFPHIPHIPGLNVAGVPLGPVASSRGAPASAAAGGVTVNVFGAVDPEGTARAIRRILESSDRRLGRRVV
jgi:hypothetical protein